MKMQDLWAVKVIHRQAYKIAGDDGERTMEIWKNEGRTVFVPREEVATQPEVKEQIDEMMPEWLIIEIQNGREYKAGE